MNLVDYVVLYYLRNFDEVNQISEIKNFIMFFWDVLSRFFFFYPIR